MIFYVFYAKFHRKKVSICLANIALDENSLLVVGMMERFEDLHFSMKMPLARFNSFSP
ncbi:MAG: hypothetical protein LBP40_00345 [Campylobacteraceae bacterium]|nr:hypothetical protein [Campylobacteraceae bacterium]